MNKSLFVQFAAYFTKIAKTLEERVNGKKTEQTYLHKEMLRKEMSTDLKWDSLSIDGTTVAADVVSMDSALPLKNRDVIQMANGDIPKVGTKRFLSEKAMSDIDVLKARNAETKILVEKIFADTVKVTMGVYEKLELMFLNALSSGVMLVDDDTNVGRGIRVDFGYKASNMFGAETKWSDPNAKPLDDVKRVLKIAKSKGDTITVLMMDDATFDAFAASQQVREQFAFSQNFVGSNIPVPDLEKVNGMLKNNSQYKITIQIVDRTVTTERDGVRTVHQAWAANKVVFLTSTKVGRLVYGMLAEDSRRNPAVMYEKVDDFILLKKWHTPEPFSEYTSSQGLVLPVIDNVASIYVLDAEEAADDAQTEGNSTFDYEGNDYTKASVIAGLNAANPKNTLTASSTDANILKAINNLSEEQIALFEAQLVAAP